MTMDLDKYRKPKREQLNVEVRVETKEALQGVCENLEFRGVRETIEFLLDFYEQHKGELKDGL